MDPHIRVEPDEVRALAADLTRCAGDHEEEARRCRVSAGTLSGALGGVEGEQAGSVALAWAGLVEALAGRLGDLAGTLLSAVAGYQQLDATLAAELTGGPR